MLLLLCCSVSLNVDDSETVRWVSDRFHRDHNLRIVPKIPVPENKTYVKGAVSLLRAGIHLLHRCRRVTIVDCRFDRSGCAPIQCPFPLHWTFWKLVHHHEFVSPTHHLPSLIASQLPATSRQSRHCDTILSSSLFFFLITILVTIYSSHPTMSMHKKILQGRDVFFFFLNDALSNLNTDCDGESGSLDFSLGNLLIPARPTIVPNFCSLFRRDDTHAWS